MSKLLKVAIVGRMNVGKSMLFNRLAINVKSITMDYEGVTRDFLSDVVSWQGLSFELIDTGGISLRKFQDDLSEKVRHIGLQVVQDADLILFVVDGKEGLTIQDREINDYLFKLDKKVLCAVNKVDNPQAQEQLYDFYGIGRQPLYPISALQGTGIGDLLEAIVNELKKMPQRQEQEEKPKLNMVLLGKPNVGKSSLLNILLERDRALVSDIPGTTREPITETLRFYKETLNVTDTPGVRRKRGVTDPLETLMVKTAFKAVDRADVVLLLVDGAEGKLSDQELKLAFYAFQEQHKALIILINKDDIIDEHAKEQLYENMKEYEFLMRKVPVLHISCKTGHNIGKILPLVHEVWNHYSHSFSDQELTLLFKDALQRKPLYYQMELLVLRRAKQVKTAPITIVLYVNRPEFFGPTQCGYLEGALRKQYDLKGAPIKFLTRSSNSQ